MIAKGITLYRRCRTDEGWKRYPVAYGKNGRVRPGYVQIADDQVLYEQGTYEIRRYQDGKRVWAPAGDVASEALNLLVRMQRKQDAKAVAASAGLEVVSEHNDDQPTLQQSANALVRDAERSKHFEAAAMNRRFTDEFFTVVRREYAHEISRADLFDYIDALHRKGNADRTVVNKFKRLRSFLRKAKVPEAIFPGVPRCETKLPTIYAPDMAGLAIKSGDERLRLALSVGLMLGLRDQELQVVEHTDINQHEGLLKIQDKPQWKFKIKDSEQREIPIPDDLFNALNEWHKRQPNKRLMFGTKSDKRDGHLLRGLKRAAKNAGLNCNRCKGCRGKNKECRDFTLHKFRRTYVATLVRNIDVTTAQALAGHADLATTMCYLTPATGVEVRNKINAIKWTA